MNEKSPLPSAWERSDENALAPLPRIRRADRQQVDPQPRRLDELIDAEHPARVVWEFVEGLDLSALYEWIRAVEGHAGRSAIDARILLALCLYATLDGVGSARRLAKLCQEHNAYRWLCEGVSVNYHTLSDFRVQHGAWLEAQLTLQVATLMAEGLVDLNRTAQDGVRVRASAGAGGDAGGGAQPDARGRLAPEGRCHRLRRLNPAQGDSHRQVFNPVTWASGLTTRMNRRNSSRKKLTEFLEPLFTLW